MTKSYPDITKRISSNMKVLRKDIADTMQGFSAMAQAATKDGALDKKANINHKSQSLATQYNTSFQTLVTIFILQ
jgi:hypothetical protein